MADPRRELADRATDAWERYASARRHGGTPEQCRAAFAAAREADRRLAEYDWAQETAERRERAARALSGA